MKSSAKKVELASVDDLFSTEESRADAQRERVMEIPLSELHPFKNHPFKVKDDEATRIAGSDFPHEVVRSRFLKLTSEHIRFVMDCMKKNTTDVRNMKQYLLTVLFNSPTTINNYYTAQVNHDMNAGGW